MSTTPNGEARQFSIARGVRRAFNSMESERDFPDWLLGFLAIAIGGWFMMPGWPHTRFPGVVKDLSGMFGINISMPMWVWGIMLVATGITGLWAALSRRRSVLVGVYLCSCPLWIYLACVMCFRHIPPPLGPVAVVIGGGVLMRLRQIPNGE